MVSTGGVVTVSEVTGSGVEYSSSVSITYLSSSHSGTYTCTSTVVPLRPSVFITSSVSQTASTQFTASKDREREGEGRWGGWNNPLCPDQWVFVFHHAAIQVTIEITYSSPDTYPVYSPPNYRAASGPVTLRCMAAGTTGSVTYRWSSTCASCFSSSSSSQTITESFLRSHDGGTHTCSVTDGNENTGTANTTMNIVGKLLPYN